jgi:hypothetical protein
MSSGGFRSKSLSTEAEIIIEVLPLATHKPRHYLYAVLPAVLFYSFIHQIASKHLSLPSNSLKSRLLSKVSPENSQENKIFLYWKQALI